MAGYKLKVKYALADTYIYIMSFQQNTIEKGRLCLESLSEALNDLKKEEDTIEIVKTGYKQCPECGGNIKLVERSNQEKGLMSVFGKNGVRYVNHKEHRCQEKYCRNGLYHSYMMTKEGKRNITGIVWPYPKRFL